MRLVPPHTAGAGRKGNQMPRRYIWSDSLTSREIDGQLFTAKMSVEFQAVDDQGNAEKDAKPTAYAAEWDVAENTAQAIQALIENDDLVTFILRLRNMVSLAADPEIVRKWALEQTNADGSKRYPALKERGRVPADITAAYRREVTTKTNAADSAK